MTREIKIIRFIKTLTVVVMENAKLKIEIFKTFFVAVVINKWLKVGGSKIKIPKGYFSFVTPLGNRLERQI